MAVVAVSGEPFPKSAQLSRGERRYRRKVASAKQWAAFKEAKREPCRVCEERPGTSLHHVVPRDAPYFGDDVLANLAPVCIECHPMLHLREPKTCRDLCASLTDAEYAYVIGKLGEGAFERVYGIEYGR